jgi:release factor glutamine methyltransferase
VTSPAVATARALLAEGGAALAAAGLATARLDAEWLLANLAEVDRLALHLMALDVDTDLVARYRAGIERRATHEPLQHILGWDEFCGLRLSVGPAVLVPRPETEGLVSWALELLPAAGRACDVGTGSGCIAAALAAARPAARIIALDRSLPALRVAAANLRALGVNEHVQLVAGDLFDPLLSRREAFDLVVANPPYLPSPLIPTLPPEVRQWEPRDALDGGPDGMAVLRRIIADAPAHLSPDGWLLLEIGEGQLAPLAELMAEHGFSDVRSRHDLAGVERYLGGRAGRANRSVPVAAAAQPEARVNNLRSSGGRIARRSPRRAELRFRESAKRAAAVDLGGRFRKGGEAPLRVT